MLRELAYYCGSTPRCGQWGARHGINIKTFCSTFVFCHKTLVQVTNCETVLQTSSGNLSEQKYPVPITPETASRKLELSLCRGLVPSILHYTDEVIFQHQASLSSSVTSDSTLTISHTFSDIKTPSWGATIVGHDQTILRWRAESVWPATAVILSEMTTHVQYSDIMRFTARHNRHCKVSQTVLSFICHKIVTILLGIWVMVTLRDAYTVCQEPHYSGVLDNPLDHALHSLTGWSRRGIVLTTCRVSASNFIWGLMVLPTSQIYVFEWL